MRWWSSGLSWSKRFPVTMLQSVFTMAVWQCVFTGVNSPFVFLFNLNLKIRHTVYWSRSSTIILCLYVSISVDIYLNSSISSRTSSIMESSIFRFPKPNSRNTWRQNLRCSAHCSPVPKTRPAIQKYDLCWKILLLHLTWEIRFFKVPLIDEGM